MDKLGAALQQAQQAITGTLPAGTTRAKTLDILDQCVTVAGERASSEGRAVRVWDVCEAVNGAHAGILAGVDALTDAQHAALFRAESVLRDSL